MSQGQSPDVTFAPALTTFIDQEVLPGLRVEREVFWAAFSRIVARFSPMNAQLLAKRDWLQHLIDARNKGLAFQAPSPAEEAEFLRLIGYLVEEPPPFTIGTTNVDPEIAALAAPQLVVPVDNARYALNAANARWGSLYDALYGSNALPGEAKGPGFDLARGDQVIAWCRAFLDEVFPLDGASHKDVSAYQVVGERLVADGHGLCDPAQFAGWSGEPEAPTEILLRNNGLHLILRVDGDSPIGRRDRAGVSDIILESAGSAIMDFEDSVAAVDVGDKIGVYRNWLGLMKGDLVASFQKDGRTRQRRLARDRRFTAPDGGDLVLKGRSLMLARNVGLLMSTPLARLNGQEVPEGVVDCVVTALIAAHDVWGERRNSAQGSVYIVKPKLHGPEEAAFTNALFEAAEQAVGLEPKTLKIGVMDEERRTSVNLRAVIAEVQDRVAFINTGFLDRTGDEIHTAMRLGPVLAKPDMKAAAWLQAYEARNVEAGLACGFSGRAQIGKGMWAMPDDMAGMLVQKIAHPQAGATTAWVPSPTAATLHALHYHRVDVFARQAELADRRTPIDGLLTAPIADPAAWSPSFLAREIDSNVQGILGYVVRWVDLGVGCSKVPDLDGVGLMEDRATCRISSQILANWLAHGVITADAIEASILRMAAVVDDQNALDPAYRPMAPDLAAHRAVAAARALIFQGAEAANGYTEPALHAARLGSKADRPQG